MTKAKTTHEERVAMLAEYNPDDLNAMWLTLWQRGTIKARDEFATAMVDAGYTLDADRTPLTELPKWRKLIDR